MNTAARRRRLAVQPCSPLNAALRQCVAKKKRSWEKWETAAFKKVPQRAARKANGAPPWRRQLSTSLRTPQIATRNAVQQRCETQRASGKASVDCASIRRSSSTSAAKNGEGFDALQLNGAPQPQQATKQHMGHQMERRRPWRTGRPEWLRDLACRKWIRREASAKCKARHKGDEGSNAQAGPCGLAARDAAQRGNASRSASQLVVIATTSSRDVFNSIQSDTNRRKIVEIRKDWRMARVRRGVNEASACASAARRQAWWSAQGLKGMRRTRKYCTARELWAQRRNSTRYSALP
ncbi:hypothetical protein ERJ75_001488200 [Trypanosoma vivax]|nr:hypothetical protein ERJ75_001488200 [Trypanosoma vivax]